MLAAVSSVQVPFYPQAAQELRAHFQIEVRVEHWPIRIQQQVEVIECCGLTARLCARSLYGRVQCFLHGSPSCWVRTYPFCCLNFSHLVLTPSQA